MLFLLWQLCPCNDILPHGLRVETIGGSSESHSHEKQLDCHIFFPLSMLWRADVSAFTMWGEHQGVVDKDKGKSGFHNDWWITQQNSENLERLTISNVDENGTTTTPLHCLWKGIMVESFWKTLQKFLKKLNIYLT